MKIKYLIVAVILLFVNQAHAQFWKSVIKIATNPVGWVTEQTVKKVTGNTNVGQVFNPTSVVIDKSLPPIQRVTTYADQFINAAIQTGNVMALSNIPNPWFIQTVMGIKVARQNGLISNETDCKDLAHKIAIGIYVAANIYTGDPQISQNIKFFTDEFGKAACEVSYYQYTDGTYGVTPQKNLSSGQTLNGNEVQYNYNSNNITPFQIGSCFSNFSGGNYYYSVMSNGTVYRIWNNGFTQFAANMSFDPTGTFFYIYQSWEAPYYWYGIDWQGNVWGRNAWLQPVIVGGCN